MDKARNEVLRKLKDWAATTSDVSCIVVAGSSARKDYPPDEFSDVDVVIFSSNSSFYQQNFDWIHQIDTPVLYYKDRLDRNIVGRKVYFANGVGLDIFFLDEKSVRWSYLYAKVSKRKWLFAALPKPVKRIMNGAAFFFTEYIRRGFYCLVDKGKFEERLHYINDTFTFKQEAFSREKLEHVINSFWRYALHTGINLQRREYWHAKITCDHGMKKTLLVLIEIYTKVANGRDYDTWHHARFLEKWAAPFIVERLPHIYGHYEMEDAWKCMKETADLFSEITQQIHTHIPDLKLLNPETHVRKWLEEMWVKEQALAG